MNPNTEKLLGFVLTPVFVPILIRSVVVRVVPLLFDKLVNVLSEYDNRPSMYAVLTFVVSFHV